MINKIIELLKTKEKMSTTEISSRLKKLYYMTLFELENLEKEGKVEKIIETNATYWRLK